MASLSVDAGADALVLALRDLTEEVKRVRWALCSVGLLYLDSHSVELSQEELEHNFAALDALRKL